MMEDLIILDDLNKQQADVHHKILPTLFEEHVAKHPHQTALIFKNKKFSYLELNAKANQVAHYLRGLGTTNRMVALCMKPSFDLLTALIGILKAGKAYIPLDPNNPSSRIQFILKDTQSNVILTHSSEMRCFENTNANILCLDDSQSDLNNYSINNPVHTNKPDDLAYVIYTSGSTGRPKGVMITHYNVISFIHWFSKALSVSKKDIFDFSSSISFDFAVATTLFPLMQGAKIAICPETIKKDPYLYVKHLRDSEVTIIKTTPSHFRSLKEVVLNEKSKLFLRYIVFGGDSLFVADIKDWLKQFPKQILFCEYGPTETTVATTWIKVDKDNVNQFKNKIPIGKPALNTYAYILDEKLHPVPTNVVGELYIGGRGVAKGYLNRQDLTDAKFIKNPFNKPHTDRLYRTGDYCRFLADGNIEFIERVDNQVKIRGYRIEMEEIEAYLIAHPDIKEVVVTARQIDDALIADKQLVAYCVPKTQKKISSSELRSYLKKQLPDYMIPEVFEMLKKMPLSANGKVDRLYLPEPTRTVNKQNEIPSTELERSLKTIWEEVLHLKHINSDDNFFHLGGNSLGAARVIAKIRQKLNKEISLQDFYNTLTIRNLAMLIKKAQVIQESPTLDPIQIIPHENKIPLSELQFLFWLMRSFYPKAKILNITDRKRFSGQLALDVLNQALDYVCKNHPILSYYISYFTPIQQWQQLPSPRVEAIDLMHLSSEEQQLELSRSLDMLQHIVWKKNDYLFRVRLFNLGSDLSELQVGVSHFISDEISSRLFINNLSDYYLACLNQKKIIIDTYRRQYSHYVAHHIIKLEHNLKKDIKFWEAYLKDIPYLYFPEGYIVKDTDALNTSCIKIPKVVLARLKSMCTANSLSITDSLIAHISTALLPFINKNNKMLAINYVKSTRDSDEYCEAMGLFLRTDLIKIDLNHSSDCIELSKRIQKSIMETASYQSCPTIIKLGCLLKEKWEHNKISNKFSTFFSKAYALLVPKSKLNYHILSMFLRVFSTRKSNNFFINVNITNQFISKNKDKKLFDFDLKTVESHHSDGSVDKNILNICFDRDSEDKTSLILSGNLTAIFLEQLNKEIIKSITRFSLHNK